MSTPRSPGSRLARLLGALAPSRPLLGALAPSGPSAPWYGAGLLAPDLAEAAGPRAMRLLDWTGPA